MQFRHPELLYALLLLIIPILVHLFQLRKFKKEAFTNVAFLKKVNLQTRKSNTIKKWLVLFTRMAALAMIVLAFAQPFITQSDVATKAKETVVYLDNSFSMQAKGKSGPLLNQSIQDLITHIPEDTKFTLLTNTDTYKDISVKGARNSLLQIPYSSEQLPPTAISLKAKKAFSKDPSTSKSTVVVALSSKAAVPFARSKFLLNMDTGTLVS
jgi:DNA segregation ATPase FtsK/SpoIIIE-like protein